MVFTVQPSKKRKKTIGRKQKNGRSYAAYQASVAATTVNPVPPGIEASDSVPAASSRPAPKKRKDDNWRVTRAVKSAKNQAVKAVAARDRAREETIASESKARAAEASVKEIEHQLYLEKKHSRATAIKTEEDHKVKITALMEKFYNDLESAHAETELETNKRLQEEALRIESDHKHSQELRKERQYHANKIAAKQSKAEKERNGQAAIIDFLHKQWKDKMAATKLRNEERTAKETAKWVKKIEKKEEKMANCIAQNEKRSVFAVISLPTTNQTHCFIFLSYRAAKMQQRLDITSAQVLDEKKKRRVQVAKEVEKRHIVEQTVDDLYDWIDELHFEINEQKQVNSMAKKAIKKAQSSKNKLETVASKRLSILRDLKCSLREAKDMLADESHQREALERMQTIKFEIKRQRSVGRRGGSGKWPVHIVLLICELLVNGTPPSAVPANIQTTSAAFTGAEASELPSVNFVRQCRTVLQNINETLAALRLGNADSWHQLFTDGTTRRQIAFQNLVIALMEDGKLDPVIVSSCMILEDETSENQVKSIVDKVCANVNDILYACCVVYI